MNPWHAIGHSADRHPFHLFNKQSVNYTPRCFLSPCRTLTLARLKTKQKNHKLNPAEFAVHLETTHTDTHRDTHTVTLVDGSDLNHTVPSEAADLNLPGEPSSFTLWPGPPAAHLVL